MDADRGAVLAGSQLTNSPFKLGLIGALQFGPMLCFSFVAGAIADRLPKRRVLIGTQTALMIQAFLLSFLAWTGRVQYWHVAVLAACYGLAFTLDMPTRQSFIVEMVSKDDLPNAIALNSAMFNGARMVGPAVAGLLVDRYGVGPAFGLNGLSFVAVIVALAAMRAEGLPGPTQGTTVRAEIAAGLRYALYTPLVALILGLLLAVSLFCMNHNVLVPLLARDVLHEARTVSVFSWPRWAPGRSSGRWPWRRWSPGAPRSPSSLAPPAPPPVSRCCSRASATLGPPCSS